MKEYICQCLPRTPSNEQSLLVWNSFRAHLTDEVKAYLKRQKIDVAVIPGGLTPVLQPLDKCPKKVLGVDDQRPVRLYSGWKKEGAIAKSCTSVGA